MKVAFISLGGALAFFLGVICPVMNWLGGNGFTWYF
jgi:hypothetical protein